MAMTSPPCTHISARGREGAPLVYRPFISALLMSFATHAARTSAIPEFAITLNSPGARSDR